MKFILLGLLSSGLLFMLACKQMESKDQKLISKVEAEIKGYQSQLVGYETTTNTFDVFQKEVDSAIPSQEGAPADSLKTGANTLLTRARAALVAYRQGITSLTTRLTEYQAGTATKEALELESKTVQVSLKNMNQAFNNFQAQREKYQKDLSARKK